jgi:hypothetical protein
MRRLAPEWPDGLGHLITPANGNSVDTLVDTGLCWAVDNAAFSGFDAGSFRRLLQRIAEKSRCLFVVCPDVVADAKATIGLFSEWQEEVKATGQPIAFVLQDGQEDLPLPEADAYFIGGSTKWKLSQQAADLSQEAKARGAWLHMGRVNSLRRMDAAAEMGCDSIDGSSASRFGDIKIPLYLRWIRNIRREPRALFTSIEPTSTRGLALADSACG